MRGTVGGRTARALRASALHPDPFRSIDAQASPDRLIQALEERGRNPSQRRLRRRFLDRLRLQSDARVLEVGCGSGVVVRDLAARLGPRGEVVGVDPSRRAIAAARALAKPDGPRAPRITLRVANGLTLPFRSARFDVAVGVTVVLHVADPKTLVTEMMRVVRPAGRIGLQDQDFGTLAITHPDRELTDHILRGVVSKVYEEPYSGRRLPGLLREAGAEDVELRTDVYQDTTLEPYTKTFLERRAELAVRYALVDAGTAQRWLDGFTALVAGGEFVMTINYYGAVGVKPDVRTRRAR